MKKIVFLTLSFLLLYTSAFANFNVINVTSLPNVDVGNLIIGDTYYANGIALSNTSVNFNHKFSFFVDSDFSFGLGLVNSPYVTNGANFPFINVKIFDLIDGYTAKLFNNDNVEISSGTEFSKNMLDSGSYYLQIFGTTAGIAGGSYNLSFTSGAPVPLPGAALFLGAGLLGLVGLRRRQM